jgi:hypothetical protein
MNVVNLMDLEVIDYRLESTDRDPESKLLTNHLGSIEVIITFTLNGEENYFTYQNNDNETVELYDAEAHFDNLSENLSTQEFNKLNETLKRRAQEEFDDYLRDLKLEACERLLEQVVKKEEIELGHGFYLNTGENLRTEVEDTELDSKSIYLISTVGYQRIYNAEELLGELNNFFTTCEIYDLSVPINQ